MPKYFILSISNTKNTMRKNIFYLLFFSLLLHSSNSLANSIDSLKLLLKSSKEDSNKVYLYINLNKELSLTDLKTILSNADKGIRLAKKVKFMKGEAIIYEQLGNLYGLLPNYKKAEEYYRKCIKKLKLFNTKKISDEYYNIALLYANQDDYKTALSYLLKSLKIDEKFNNKSGMSWTTLEIGYIYQKLRLYPKAISNFQNSARLARELNEDELEIMSLNNIGNSYFKLKDFDKAIDYFNQSLAIANQNFPSRRATIINNIASIYFEKKEYDKVISCYKKSLIIYDKNLEKRDISIAYSNLAEVYAKINKINDAINYGEKSMAIAEEINYNEQKLINYLLFSKIYKETKEFKKAIDYLDKYNLLKDSLFTIENSKIISDLETKYQTELKQKKIIELKTNIKEKQKNQEILENKIQKRNIIIGGTILATILLTISLILFFNRRRLILANHHQKEINEQRELTTREIVQALEKEQSRIAKDLHDSIGTFLSTLKINLQLYEEEVPVEKQKSFNNTLTLIDKISFELRNIMKNLSHDTLQEQGLAKAVEEFVGRINELKVTAVAHYISDLSPAATEHIQHNLYRISQELVTNCIKHAKANNASIQIIEDENGISLVYEDDGIGILPSLIDNRNASQNMGLKNIFNRVEFIRGVIQIDSNPKSGTTIIIEIPTK